MYVFTQMQDEAFSLNLVLKCIRLDCSELDHAEPNQRLHHLIITYSWKREQSMTKVVQLYSNDKDIIKYL
jgi:PHP family Zn ribbon phosphoesterase